MRQTRSLVCGTWPRPSKSGNSSTTHRFQPWSCPPTASGLSPAARPFTRGDRHGQGNHPGTRWRLLRSVVRQRHGKWRATVPEDKGAKIVNLVEGQSVRLWDAQTGKFARLSGTLRTAAIEVSSCRPTANGCGLTARTNSTCRSAGNGTQRQEGKSRQPRSEAPLAS